MQWPHFCGACIAFHSFRSSPLYIVQPGQRRVHRPSTSHAKKRDRRRSDGRIREWIRSYTFLQDFHWCLKLLLAYFKYEEL
eukprot:scaffold148_cov341-Pavlova_lutheri.AAC.39